MGNQSYLRLGTNTSVSVSHADPTGLVTARTVLIVHPKLFRRDRLPLELSGERATALGMAACAQGKKVRFWRVTELITTLRVADQDRQLLRFRHQLGRLDLLILDELGYVAASKAGAELLFDVIASAYERSSVVLTTNLRKLPAPIRQAAQETLTRLPNGDAATYTSTDLALYPSPNLRRSSGSLFSVNSNRPICGRAISVTCRETGEAILP
ncbi:MAG TPA: ATP-binding protein [Fimbriiglobus sp.]